jgi:hypothetical protein
MAASPMPRPTAGDSPLVQDARFTSDECVKLCLLADEATRPDL